jgi:dTDP-4-dehydrorhamnose 3,5-epimerase
MKFKETPLQGAYLIELEKRGDDRGFFARAFCVNEFNDHQLDNNIVQINNSLSKDKGTLRGLHYQLNPKAEDKIVRCISGSLYDVIIDLRPQSDTFKKWFGTELNSANRNSLFVPKGFAHGFITLEENTEAFYLVTEFYSPEHERGIRFNDPTFNINWPIDPIVISEKDNNHPYFNPDYHLK